MATMLSHHITDFLCCFLLLLCLTGTTMLLDQNPTLQSCNTWRRAHETCSLKPMSTLPMIMKSSDYHRVKQAMETYRINTTWLALRRHQLIDFQWLDCQKAPDDFLKHKWSETSNCAYLNTRDQSLDAGMCPVERGVACQLRDCSECGVSNCHRIKDGCYVTSCTKFTWEAARAHCNSHGWDLAVLGSNDMELRKEMSAIWANTCVFLWVGLRRHEWTYIGKRNMTAVYWGRTEPALEGNCSIMRKTTAGYIWQAVNCQQNHESLCMTTEANKQNVSPPNLLSTPPAASVQTTMSSGSQVRVQQTWTQPILVSTAVIFLVMAIVCMGLFFMMRRKWKKDLQKALRLTCLQQESPDAIRRRVPERDYSFHYPAAMKKTLSKTEEESVQTDLIPPESGASCKPEYTDERVYFPVLSAENPGTHTTKSLRLYQNGDTSS